MNQSIMNISTNRLKTFTQHEPPWPYIDDSSYHATEEFANAGFYNISTKRNVDKVQCYLCNITLADWKQGQSPLGRHAHAAKTCPLVLLNFPDTLTTVPIVEQDANTHPESDFMIKTRLKTFTKNRAWPPQMLTDNAQPPETRQSSKQRSHPTAPKLAEAGFIFLPTLNEPDRVKCPYCQFCLSNFNGASSPWIQHQKAKPNCLYVTRRKATLPAKRSSLPQKRSTSTGTTSTSKKNRRATTNSLDKENEANVVDDHDGTPTTGVNANETNNLSRLDDSIWDIAKAQLEYKPNPDLATTDLQRPPNAKPLVTYERKKHKKPTKVLPPELTKQRPPSANAKQSNDSSTTSRTRKQQADSSNSSQQQHSTTTTPTASQEKDVEETPAQVLARLQKKPVDLSTPKDKGKGRALDSIPPTTKKMTTGKKMTPETSTSRLKLSELTPLSSSPMTTAAAAAAVMTPATATTTTTTMETAISAATASASQLNNSLISDSESIQQQPRYHFLASTPSSTNRRPSNLHSSTPIHSRIDHGNDLMALTLSPIRGAGSNMTGTTTTTSGGVFGSLETPMTTTSRIGPPSSQELDISEQIEQRFRAKRRLGSSSSPLQRKAATPKPSDHTYYSSGTPLLDFDDLDDDDDDDNDNKNAGTTDNKNAGTTDNKNTNTADNNIGTAVATPNESDTQLTDEQLALTVEGYIQSLVEHRVAIVKQHGEALIKSIQQEVADTKKSILTNHS